MAVWVSSNVCPVFFLSLLLRPTSLCSSEVARLASSRHTSASQVLRYEHQVAKCPQVSTRINAIRMIRYGIILPLTQLTTNWCPFCKAQQRDWTCRRCAGPWYPFMTCENLCCSFFFASISRLALWHCHTLKDVEELVASNLRRSFNGWVQGVQGGLGNRLSYIS